MSGSSICIALLGHGKAQGWPPNGEAVNKSYDCEYGLAPHGCTFRNCPRRGKLGGSVSRLDAPTCNGCATGGVCDPARGCAPDGIASATKLKPSTVTSASQKRLAVRSPIFMNISNPSNLPPTSSRPKIYSSIVALPKLPGAFHLVPSSDRRAGRTVPAREQYGALAYVTHAFLGVEDQGSQEVGVARIG